MPVHYSNQRCVIIYKIMFCLTRDEEVIWANVGLSNYIPDASGDAGKPRSSHKASPWLRHQASELTVKFSFHKYVVKRATDTSLMQSDIPSQEELPESFPASQVLLRTK